MSVEEGRGVSPEIPKGRPYPPPCLKSLRCASEQLGCINKQKILLLKLFVSLTLSFSFSFISVHGSCEGGVFRGIAWGASPPPHYNLHVYLLSFPFYSVFCIIPHYLCTSVGHSNTVSDILGGGAMPPFSP